MIEVRSSSFFEHDGREIELASRSSSFALSSELLLGEGLSKSSQESTLEGLKLSEDSSPLSAILIFFLASGEMMTSVKIRSVLVIGH